MGKRGFAEVKISVLGTQSADDRFGRRSRDGDCESRPPVAGWRCNLTALSQVHNLLFVAYSDQIHVYCPTFKSQALSKDPALIVASKPSAPGLVSHIDPRQPHAINNLIVQFLGNEEVVATVRDDGDVDAFLVRHIVQAIERRAESTLGSVVEDMRPIFLRNVGQSAWGLAIHSNARILAVSANSQQVTIFKLGLVCPEEEDASDPEDQFHQVPDAVGREIDVTYRVVNGTSNIPHIAFCNTGDDPDARWLLTTDISGYCRTIDLHSMSTVQKFRFGHSSISRYVGSFDHVNAGWTLMFLDSRSFIPESTFQAALGLKAGEGLPGIKVNQSIWDISATLAHVPDCSADFVRHRVRPRQATSIYEAPVSDISSPASRPHQNRSSTASDAEMQYEEDTGVFSDQSALLSEDTAGVAAEVMDDSDSVHDESEDEATEYVRSLSSNEPRCDTYDNLCGDLPCPILHASVRSVFLLQPSHHREAAASPCTAPTVGFTNALKQNVAGALAYINVFERMNMHAYLPQIGVLILASQKGRAVVLSLTKTSNLAPALPHMPAQPSGKPKTTYGMRLEYLLPLASQEQNGQRPFAPLAGIAAGPMQGTEHLPSEKKRWRFIMMYADHSVLTYELRRPHPRDPNTKLESIVV